MYAIIHQAFLRRSKAFILARECFMILLYVHSGRASQSISDCGENEQYFFSQDESIIFYMKY